MEKRLFPFIEEFHIDGNYIFWPDMASAHYSNEGGWEATTEQQLIDRIHRKLRKFDLKCVESLMRGVKAKFKSKGQHGVFPLFKK